MIFSVKTITAQQLDEYNSFPTFIEHNGMFVLYFLEPCTNVDGCHRIDVAVNRFEIKTRMLLNSADAMDRADLYT